MGGSGTTSKDYPGAVPGQQLQAALEYQSWEGCQECRGGKDQADRNTHGERGQTDWT